MAPSRPSTSHTGDNSGGANTVYGTQQNLGPLHFHSPVPVSSEDQNWISDFYTVSWEAEMKKVGEPLARTCEWLEHCTEFDVWSTTDQNVLCLVGDPGTGKSTIAKHLLNTRLRRSPRRVIYFFCNPELTDRKDGGKQPTAVSVLRNLIHQCLIHARINNVISSYVTHVKNAKVEFGQALFDSPTHLTMLFARLLSVPEPEACPWYCIIDAFDCLSVNESEGQELFGCLTTDLKQYVKQYTGDDIHMRLKIFITSRPTGEITSIIKHSEAVKILCLADKSGVLLNATDLEMYVDDNLDDMDMDHFPKEEKRNLRRKLMTDAAGNFKWASSMIEALQDNPFKWRKTLSATSLTDAVSMLETLAENLDELRECLLGVIINALRPLVLPELAAAINIEGGSFARLDFIGHNDMMISENLRLREAAVRLVGDEVRLCHPEMKRVMVERWNRLNEHQISDIHLQMAEACLTYLTTVLRGRALLQGTRREHCTQNYLRLVGEFPFLNYASCAWHYHVSKVALPNSRIVWEHIQRTLGDNGIRELAFQIHQFVVEDEFVAGQSLLHVLVYHNLTTLTEQVLFRDLPFAQLNANARDEKGRTPLWVAVDKGHEMLVKYLLRTGGVNCNITDSDKGLSPGMLAVKRGYRSIAQLFLDAGSARVSWTTEDVDGRRPLWIAAARGDSDMVKRLLRIKDIRDHLETKSQGQPPLVVAARKGYTEVVRLLVKKRASVNAQGDDGRTSLSWAAGNGHEAIVDCLLDQEDIDLSRRDIMLNQTPLHWAAVRKDRTIARKIFRKTQQLDGAIWPRDQTSMLLEAAERGQIGVFEILLEQGGAGVEPRHKAFFLAAKKGHIDIVNALLNSGEVNVNSTDQNRKTALMCTAEEGRTEMIERLLNQKNIMIDAVDPDGRRADEWARRSGYSNIIRLLEAKRSELRQSDSQAGTTESETRTSNR